MSAWVRSQVWSLTAISSIFLVAALAGAARAGTADADALRRLAQSELDAGRLSAYRVVEPYGVVGASLLLPAAQADEAAAEAAQDFADEFCAKASRAHELPRSWRLIVYVHGQPHDAYSCSIETSARGPAYTPGEESNRCNEAALKNDPEEDFD